MNSYDIAALEQRFGIAGEVSFAEGPHGMPVADVSNAQAMGCIALQGAQLLSWAPHSQELVIWLSPLAKFGPGKAVRGGVPVCWPWFGPHAGEPSFPAHGFARTAPWEAVEAEALEDGSDRLGFRLIRDEASFGLWPHSTPVEIRYTLGAALEIELRTCNQTPNPITLGEALHTYFNVGDVRRIKIEGLDGCEYLDKVDGGQRRRQSGPVAINGETDRVYLDTTADCVIEDPGLGRRIRIEKLGSRSTVVWNPWEEKARKMGDIPEDGYLGMVCVESANAGENAVTLAPGEEHRLWARYSVEALR
jgi:glucose-6-phosphate 1-epimerase